MFTSSVRLVDLKYSNAAGIVSAIKSSFQSIDIPEVFFEKKLIGFAADGAIVNRGQKDGVLSILQSNLPWVIYVWCVAHRLELALKGALQGTIFDDVDQVLLHLYFLMKSRLKSFDSCVNSTACTAKPLNLNWAESDRSEHVVTFGFHFAYQQCATVCCQNIT